MAHGFAKPEIPRGQPQEIQSNIMVMMNSLSGLPIETLKRAVGIREQIDELTIELNELLSQPRMRPAVTFGARTSKGRELSAAGRARIATAQRLRWAKYNAGRSKPVVNHSKKPRLSAQGRAKVSAAVAARWERYRAAKALGLRLK